MVIHGLYVPVWLLAIWLLNLLLALAFGVQLLYSYRLDKSIRQELRRVQELESELATYRSTSVKLA